MGRKKIFELNATLVANEFIDKYMPDANGDYVKVYLYLLRTGELEKKDQSNDNSFPVPDCAEALHLTEGDVLRAIKYWQGKDLLPEDEDRDVPLITDSMAKGSHFPKEDEDPGHKSEFKDAFKEIDIKDELRNRYRRTEGKAILDRLDSDTDFGELVFIVQRYLSKILTERDQEVIAFLYDGLKLPSDVIEYLVEYCVKNGHNNIRYIETAGMDWASQGIRTVRGAKKYTENFEKAGQNVSSKRKRLKKAELSRGITRDTDLDDIVKEKVLKRM